MGESYGAILIPNDGGHRFGDAEQASGEERFAAGTRELDKLCDDDLGEDATAVVELTTLPHAMFLLDASDHIEDANARAELLTGFLRSELLGVPIAHVVSDVAGATTAGRERFMPFTANVHHRTGHEIPASVLVHAHERGTLVACIHSHDSERDGFRSLSTAQIAHDLKSPLATIALEMCLLDERLASAVPADLRRVAARVNHNVDYLDRLVQDLLDSCAIDIGEFALQLKEVELRARLESIIDRTLATPDRGRVLLEAPTAITLSIDDLRIERVVANLLQNALKYAPRSSAIVVRLEVHERTIRVSVIDDGPGLAPDEIPYVFDKYRRGAQSRRCQGSGLGLYVSKQIIQAHGGRIGVDSVPGLGSRFYFDLPRPELTGDRPRTHSG